MRRKLQFIAVVLLYWVIAVRLLQKCSPVFMDGAGPLPTFFWGTPPLPTLEEYLRREIYYDLLFGIPYFVVSAVIVLVGAVITPFVLQRFSPSQSNVFRDAAAVTFALLLVLAILADAGTLMGVWNRTVFVLRRFESLYDVLLLGKLLVSLSLFAGVWNLLRNDIRA